VTTEHDDAAAEVLPAAGVIIRVAGRLLAESCGSEAQAAVLVNEWVNESVKTRVRSVALREVTSLVRNPLQFVEPVRQPGLWVMRPCRPGPRAGLPALSAPRSRFVPAVLLRVWRQPGTLRLWSRASSDTDGRASPGESAPEVLASRSLPAVCCHSVRRLAGSGRRSGTWRCSVKGLPVHARFPHRFDLRGCAHVSVPATG
jgi:hypothetical protein